MLADIKLRNLKPRDKEEIKERKHFRVQTD